MPKELKMLAYKFEELSSKIQNKLYNEWINNNEYDWHEFNIKTLNEFADIFNCRIVSYSYGGRNSYIDVKMNLDDNILELRGIRLAKYIWNNYKHVIYKGKYYPYRKKSKYSKIELQTDGVLTGYCMDNAILQPIYDFLKSYDKNTDFEYLLNDCFETWISAVAEDYDYCYSMEYYIENCGENYLYTEDGTILCEM